MFRDLSVHPDEQTDGQTDMAKLTLLVMLIKNIYGPSVPDQEYIYIIKNIYSLWGQETVSSTDPYFPTKLVYPLHLFDG